MSMSVINQLAYRSHLIFKNDALLVIAFLLFLISTSFLAFNSHNLQTIESNLDGVQKESSFLHLAKPPVSRHLDTISNKLKCIPTYQLKISSKPGDKCILQSYTRGGAKKEKGGDEYYVTYTDKNNNSRSPSAVAHIKDNKDGTYALHFVKSRLDMVAKTPMVGVGTVTVNLIHTCGIGLLEPPLKNNWTLNMKNGAVNAVYYSFNHPMPFMKQPYRPKSFGNELSQYDMVYAIGDSLMRDVFNGTRPNVNYLGIGASLNTETVSNIMTARAPLERKILAELQYEDNVKDKKMAVILGSCAWDLLASQSTLGEDSRYRFEMNDHLEATKSLIRIVKEEFPEMDIYWKGCTSLHHHAAYGFGNTAASLFRLLYMSSRRAKRLDVTQKAIMRDFNIPVLDMFDISFEMAEFLVPGDGRHFNKEWNQYVIDYFYPMQPKQN